MIPRRTITPKTLKRLTGSTLLSITLATSGAVFASSNEEGMGINQGPADGPMSIEEGLRHWTYRKVDPPRIPGNGANAALQHPIDAFLQAKRAEAEISPNPAADRRTLVRRATYDLTGLPPTPDEVAAFVDDPRPDAYEQLIERLLASPHYGEKWARHWMDIARYAETDGYERDGNKLNMWRYRDYLIRAFNQDKPYDRFIQEQLAGDELPDGDADSLIATGFLRLQIWDDEPVDRVQARADYIADIVDTTSEAFLATTLRCSRCHDHKKDPIEQRDYYAFYAFFNNITEPRRGNPRFIAKDVADVPPDSETAKRQSDWEQRIDELRGIIDRTFTDFRKARADIPDATPLNAGPRTPLAPTSEREAQRWRYTFDDPGAGWESQQFDDRGWPKALGGFALNTDPGHVRTSWPRANNDLWIRRTFRLTEIPHALVLRFRGDDETQVHVNGILVHSRPHAVHPYIDVQLNAEALSALVIGSNSIAVHCRDTGDGDQHLDVGLSSGIVDLAVAERAALQTEGDALLGEARMQAWREAHLEHERLIAAPPLRPYPASVIAERGSRGPEEFVHLRGNANVAGDSVAPGFPKVLGGGDAQWPSPSDGAKSTGRRLALANWLANPENPLTARVMANRIWQHHFGRGLIPSSSDFGQLGEPVSHPELLDHLATQFVAADWSIKQLHRYIMSSAAYRMSSAPQENALFKDPTNRLLWRFSMRRLTAEETRDSILAVNGSLNPQLYGPNIYTALPAEVLATASRPDAAWGRSSPEQQDRRSVYVYVKRSLREPLLFAFDQAETDTPCPVRFTTNVPTQTLIALNSDFTQMEARVFAERLRRDAGPLLRDQVCLALSLACGRPPTDAEVAENLAFIKSMQKNHALSLDDARVMFCVVCFNLNEFMYLD